MPNRNRLLIVEDDADSLSLFFSVLTLAGFSVLTAESGAQAVDLLQLGIVPRLIVLDLMMPRVTGWEMLKYLREDLVFRHIPVIVVTALDAADAKAVGADVVLTKPIAPDVLLQHVRRLLGMGASAQEV